MTKPYTATIPGVARPATASCFGSWRHVLLLLLLAAGWHARAQAPTIALAPATLPNAGIGRGYSQALTAVGGTGPYTFGIVGGALPAGLSLSAGGVLAGTPTAGGSFSFTVRATDAAASPGPYSGTASLSLVVEAPSYSGFRVSPSYPSDGLVGQAYRQVFAGYGATAPYSIYRTGGTLPPGLSLSASGVLEGTPTTSGTFRFNLRAVDSSTGTGPYSSDDYYTTELTIAPGVQPGPASLPSAGISRGYSQTLTATGGTGPYTFAIVGGRLPAGLSLSAGGVLSGTPTEGGTTVSFTVRATDSSTGYGRYTNSPPGPYSGTMSLSLYVEAPSYSGYRVYPSYPNSGRVGQAYREVFAASGGTAPYSIYRTGGTLPPGLSLSASGVLEGTPTASGTFRFNLRAVDSSTGTGPYSSDDYYTTELTIAPPAIALGAGSPPAGTVGSAFSYAFAASGGTAPYAYTLAAGTLPAGLSLSSTGTLAGTPTAGGSFPLTVRATDASGGGPHSGTGAFTLVINAPSLVLAPAALPDGTAASAYSKTLSTTGGTAPYTYTLAAGALPAGMSLSAGGVLVGTPTVSGTFNFTVMATDASTGTGPYSGSRAFALVVAPAPPVVVSVTRLTPSPTATATVQYQVVFSREVAGLSAANFTVSSSTGATVSGVSGSGTTYTVAVATGAGNGTLQLTVASGAGLTPQVVGLPYTAAPAYTLTKVFATTPRLTLRGAGNLRGVDDVTAFVDAVQVLQSGVPVAEALQNPGFESSNVLARSHLYQGSVMAAPWSFGPQAGVARSGSAFGAAASPDGDAVVFLQSAGTTHGSVAQDLTLAAGSYQVGFRVAQRDYSTKDQVVNVFLNDVLLGSIQPTATTAYETFASSTFAVQATPLPVQLTQFTATAAGPAAVRLAWATASEKNSAAFDMERSSDGRTFARIGTVAAAGTSLTPRTYALLDGQLPADAPTLYYRLRQVDQDGTFSYSPVRPVALAAVSAGLSLYPNPSHGGVTTLAGATPGTAVTVLDALGRPVATATADAAGTARLALPQGLAPGVYVVRTGTKALRLTVE